MTDIHRTAQSGFSKASSTYASGRPDYPEALGHWLQDSLGIGAGHKIVDLGAGTGKFTRILVQTGAQVIAVEPVVEMLEHLQKAHPAVVACKGSASQIPLEDNSVDAVFCAQAFHWFANVETLEEIRRVLKPDGVLVLIWNVRDETRDWVAALSKIMAPYEEGTPRFHHGKWKSVLPANGYTVPQETTFAHAHNGDFKTVVVDRVLSVSFIAALPQSARGDVEREIRKLLNCHVGLEDETSVSFPYQTFVTWMKKV